MELIKSPVSKLCPFNASGKFLGGLALVALATIFSSCATTSKYEAILNTWMGSDVNSLITAWGAPSNQYTMPNGNIMYTWLWVDNSLVTSTYFPRLKLTLTDNVTLWCKTTFITDANGKIIGWRLEGNDCRAE